jgi:hypothetical protein
LTTGGDKAFPVTIDVSAGGNTITTPSI